jgi:hypothetical protein
MNEYPVVLLHPRDQYVRKSFSAIVVLPDEWANTAQSM